VHTINNRFPDTTNAIVPASDQNPGAKRNHRRPGNDSVNPAPQHKALNLWETPLRNRVRPAVTNRKVTHVTRDRALGKWPFGAMESLNRGISILGQVS